jgi:hypothetical protein
MIVIPPILYHTERSDLLVVPAVHFNYIFARAVRQCLYEDLTPDAIAVELGPQSASAARGWLEELTMEEGRFKSLPVMLGLLKQNRILRASLKEKAIKLQKEKSEDLSELPPDILHRELGYCGRALLCLSPTDSIIEALRCAVELDLPAFGVDLEELPDRKSPSILIQDPLNAEKDLDSYVSLNAPFCEPQRDNETDVRREIVMASRLKALMKQYRRIIFTCGMAHWPRIKSLLEDPMLQAATTMGNENHRELEFVRGVVHPLIAVYFMDRFPALAEQYEMWRASLNKDEKRPTTRKTLDPFSLFEGLLEKMAQAYFQLPENGASQSMRGRDLFAYRSFKSYLDNLCLLSHRSVPNIFLAIKAARETMNREFVKDLSKALMELSWTTPETFKEYPLIAPEANMSSQSLRAKLVKRGIQLEAEFYLQMPETYNENPMIQEIPFEWEKEEIHIFREVTCRHSWLPWDYLISSMSFRALCAAKRRQLIRTVEPFSGSLLEGIEVKATLRSYSRGNETVFVKNHMKGRDSVISRIDEGFPVVWILEPGSHPDAQWTYLHHDCVSMKKHIRNKARFDKTIRMNEDMMVAVVAYGKRFIPSEASSINSKVDTDRYYGMVLYVPIGWHNHQFARWAELTDYRRNPFSGYTWKELDSSGPSSQFLQKHGLRKEGYDWETSLMLLALPYGNGFVTVVSPDEFTIHPIVFEKAKEFGVTVAHYPLSRFSKSEIDRVMICYLVPMNRTGPDTYYDQAIEEAIGEKQTKNRELYPKHWAELGSEPH